ncbi:Cfr10I/Bse634I restriction endonuclease [Antricoccus suffuscus]|uniref:Cfr10I/Bse634I restriction endonuclease n=1 Tax=Antricoccus suffuscus TaxID=1629062 RepID=A0A2T0ZTG7_9ACTN|nr:Cfr10I/Bse634I family restriction endonuclease [Antricoccus suffuscus]PRZ39649.1 Cfr10I/Bse634I restriction endonuclease [Antricoccus suffuscus]
MPFRFSQVATNALSPEDRCIQDLRDAPIRNRKTQFRLLQQNMLAYTFGAALPGWGSSGLNAMPFQEVVRQPIANARAEGDYLYGSDFTLDSNAIAKVTGDIYETLTSAILWDAAAYWNSFMATGNWPTPRRYARPSVGRSERRQVGIVNLPRRYDWVRLLEPNAKARIAVLRDKLAENNLSMPTSTPDIAVVVLPDEVRKDDIWRTPFLNLDRGSQGTLSTAHTRLADSVEPGEIILAMALKSSLRSDRLYQPLYEANVMQLLLERHLGAPRVEFEVHALTAEGTGATAIYTAASLHSAGEPTAHRAVRELYEPANATQIVQRFFAFLNQRMATVSA